MEGARAKDREHNGVWGGGGDMGGGPRGVPLGIAMEGLEFRLMAEEDPEKLRSLLPRLEVRPT